jgi:hypothetical protein
LLVIRHSEARRLIVPIGFSINVSAELRKLTRNLDALAQKQIPFAAARGVTALAKIVQTAETAALSSNLDRPTPFTKRAFAVTPATKATMTAVVYAKDIQARYLAPVELGSKQVVRKSALLMPVDIAKNAYGNIPAGALRRLKGNPNIFVGKIKTKSGEMVGGVWQRTGAGTLITRGKKKGTRQSVTAKSANQKGGLKLLIRFTAPTLVTPKLNYRTRARTIIAANFEREMSKALAAAMRTAL